MYKTKVQELCHQKRWSLPRYSTMKDGADHDPRFKSSVSVNGLSFHSSVSCKSSKESQNDAAKLAFLHFTSPPPPPPPSELHYCFFFHESTSCGNSTGPWVYYIFYWKIVVLYVMHYLIRAFNKRWAACRSRIGNGWKASNGWYQSSWYFRYHIDGKAFQESLILVYCNSIIYIYIFLS